MITLASSYNDITTGLEAQLLGIVVRKERPELEEQKDRLVVNCRGKEKVGRSGRRNIEVPYQSLATIVICIDTGY